MEGRLLVIEIVLAYMAAFRPVKGHRMLEQHNHITNLEDFCRSAVMLPSIR